MDDQRRSCVELWPGGAPDGQADRAWSPELVRDLSCVLTFDIEDWFQVENLRPAFPRAGWHRAPRRVAEGLSILLDLLAAYRLRATFFVLGWVAEQEPALVRKIAGQGHEIACHGYGHVLPTQLTQREFREDVVRAREILEGHTGQSVIGYRAPSFSLDREQLEILADCGFHYDSSVHPFALHDRYARLDDLGAPLRAGVYRLDTGLLELALPVERVGPLPMPIAGGGYFRLYPGPLFRWLVRRALIRDGHYVMYLHSWEFDAPQPRVRVPSAVDRFRHYHNLSWTLPRMHELVKMLVGMAARFVTAREFLAEVGLDAALCPSRVRAERARCPAPGRMRTGMRDAAASR